MKLCGFCKTIYPEINEDIDEICLECKMGGNNVSTVMMGV